MNTYFSRHRRDEVGAEVWLSWGGDSGRVWATKVAQAADDGASTVSEKLAEDDEIDYDTLRLLPRAFSVLNGPHTAECDGNGVVLLRWVEELRPLPLVPRADLPRARRRRRTGLGAPHAAPGRDRGAARRRLRPGRRRASTGRGGGPDARRARRHRPARVRPDHRVPRRLHLLRRWTRWTSGTRPTRSTTTQADIDPEDAHYFTETLDNPEKCEICGKAVDDTLHKQAALAAYYLLQGRRRQEDRRDPAVLGGQGRRAAARGAGHLGGRDLRRGLGRGPDADDLFERASAVDEDMDTLFWQRRGSEDDDPLTYYAAYTGDDQMMVDQLYVSDGADVLPASTRREQTWEQTSLGSPEQIYEIDDDTALAALRALAVFPDEPVDLREVDPGEALMMEERRPRPRRRR